MGSLEETKEAVEKVGGKCITIKVNHAIESEIENLFKRIDSEQTRLDILVNNCFAAVDAIGESTNQKFWEKPITHFDVVNNVGLRAHYIASVLGVRTFFLKQNSGLIVNISSFGGLSYIFDVAYGVGKIGLDRMTNDMGIELKKHNVTVIGLYPGLVSTEKMISLADKTKYKNMNLKYSETPLYTGRVVAQMALDPNLHKYTGTVRIVAELAEQYGVKDENNQQLKSLRSLASLPFIFPFFENISWILPNIRVPFWLVKIFTGIRYS